MFKRIDRYVNFGPEKKKIYMIKDINFPLFIYSVRNLHYIYSYLSYSTNVFSQS